MFLAPPSPGEPRQSLEGECLGRAAAGALEPRWGAPAPLTHTLFPPKPFITELGLQHHGQGCHSRWHSRCQTGRATSGGRGRFPRAPRRASSPPARLQRRETPGCFCLLIADTRAERAGAWAGPGCTSGRRSLQAQPGRSCKEAGQLASRPGCLPRAGLSLPRPPEGQHQQVREPGGAGSADGVCGLPSTQWRMPGAGRQLTLSHAQTNTRCPVRPAPPSGSAGAGFPTAAAHGRARRSPLPPLPRPAGRAGSEPPAHPVVRSPSVGGPAPRTSLSSTGSSRPCPVPRAEPGAQRTPSQRLTARSPAQRGRMEPLTPCSQGASQGLRNLLMVTHLLAGGPTRQGPHPTVRV